MEKEKAIELLGGSTASAAAAIDVSYQAVRKWPPRLTPRIIDRVIAGLLRTGRDVPAELLTTGRRKQHLEPAHQGGIASTGEKS